TDSKPSQSLQSDTSPTQTSVHPVAAVSKNFGANLVCGRAPAGSGIPLRPETLLTVKHVAAALGVSAATIYGLCERGELGHIRVANAIRVSQADMEKFVEGSRGAASKRRRSPDSEEGSSSAAAPPALSNGPEPE